MVFQHSMWLSPCRPCFVALWRQAIPSMTAGGGRERDALRGHRAPAHGRAVGAFAHGVDQREAAVVPGAARRDDRRAGRGRLRSAAHSAYPFMRDGDGDGVVCESRGRRARRQVQPASPRAPGTRCGPYRNCTALRRDRGRCDTRRRGHDKYGQVCER